MTAFLTSFILVTIAEMADKTQLLTLSLACRYPARKVLLGVGLAIAILNLVAVAVGAVAGRLVPINIVRIGAGMLFIAFGLWTLLSRDSARQEECEPRSARYVVLGVLAAFLLAELGDKTQLATLSLAARFESTLFASFAVWLGATLGMVLANSLAVAIGGFAGDRLPEKWLKRGSAALFIGFGIWTLLDVYI